jgi:RimJ/RimL family protein N-acetyltransferase
MLTLDYFLVSERLGFRWWTMADLLLAKKIWGDPDVTRFFVKKPLTDNQIQQRLETEIERSVTYKMQYWPMFELATNELVGCGGLRPYRDKTYELGFHLCSQFWGRGFATEAGKTAIGYGINELGAQGFFAGHHPDNTASRKVLLKLGFQEIGSVYYEPTGLLHPSYNLPAPPPRLKE